MSFKEEDIIVEIKAELTTFFTALLEESAKEELDPVELAEATTDLVMDVLQYLAEKARQEQEEEDLEPEDLNMGRPLEVAGHV